MEDHEKLVLPDPEVLLPGERTQEEKRQRQEEKRQAHAMNYGGHGAWRGFTHTGTGHKTTASTTASPTGRTLHSLADWGQSAHTAGGWFSACEALLQDLLRDGVVFWEDELTEYAAVTPAPPKKPKPAQSPYGPPVHGRWKSRR